MLLADPLYGQLNIAEPVILELLASPSLKRLAGIDAHGYTKPYWPDKMIVSRLDHSLGVYWLLKSYGAPLAEQVAGLIHDVSHSAFSHCIDYILAGDGGRQNHQDNIFAAFVKKSDIPAILEKHGLDLEYILDDRNFPLKETELPDLCADRLDYSLRAALVYEEISRSEAAGLLSSLKAIDGRWVFADLDSARRYAEIFRRLNDDYYCSLRAAAQHYAASRYLQHALQKKYISLDDLYTDDTTVLNKVRPFHAHDQALSALFLRMENQVPYRSAAPGSEAVAMTLKSRVVDPWFSDGKQIRRLSEAWPEWQAVVTAELLPKTYYPAFDA